MNKDSYRSSREHYRSNLYGRGKLNISFQKSTVGGDRTVRQSSVVTIVDGESDAYVILENGSIL